jgi:UDP-N-acetylmuramate dehydrogenase
MTAVSLINELQDFAEFVQANEPLAPYTHLKLGGPAEALVQPRTVEELCAVVRRCGEKKIPMHLLGGGCNVLVRDEGVRGVVLRLRGPAFTQVSVDGRRVRAGAGAALSALISQSARHGLSGVETLVGTPGTVGGALRHPASDRASDIGQYLCWVEVVDGAGQVQMREREELAAAARVLDDPVFLAAEFELEPDSTDAIVKHMRKAFINRKRSQPFSFQASCRVFKDPRGLSAQALIVQAGLASAKVGGAEISDRDANYIVANPGAAARDVLRLIDMVRTGVREQFNAELELELGIW